MPDADTSRVVLSVRCSVSLCPQYDGGCRRDVIVQSMDCALSAFFDNTFRCYFMFHTLFLSLFLISPHDSCHEEDFSQITPKQNIVRALSLLLLPAKKKRKTLFKRAHYPRIGRVDDRHNSK